MPKAGGQIRLIFHLSYDFGVEEEKRSLNYHTPDSLCSVKYRDLDHAVKNCLRILNDWEKINKFNKEKDTIKRLVLFFGKTDLRSAFRILPILPCQNKFLLMKARNPITKEFVFFVEKCLPFRASISCRRFQDFSNALKHLIEHRTGTKISCTNYLDDFLFCQQSKQLCDHMVSQFLALCKILGVPVLEEKTEWGTQIITFLGILLNGDTFSLSIPENKVNKALNMLHWTIQQKKVTIKHIQRLTGTLNFLNKAIVPGRAFTRGMYASLTLTDKAGNPLKTISSCFPWI